MSKHFLALVAASVLVTAGVVAADSATQSIAMSPDQIVAARQSALNMSVMTMGEMKLAVRAGLDVKKQFYAATTLILWAKALPSMFPAGTGPGTTALDNRSRPEIWTDRAGFERAAGAYLAASERLSELARAGDNEGFAAQIGVVDKTCDSCHSDYKTK